MLFGNEFLNKLGIKLGEDFMILEIPGVYFRFTERGLVDSTGRLRHQILTKLVFGEYHVLSRKSVNGTDFNSSSADEEQEFSKEDLEAYIPGMGETYYWIKIEKEVDTTEDMESGKFSYKVLAYSKIWQADGFDMERFILGNVFPTLEILQECAEEYVHDFVTAFYEHLSNNGSSDD